MSVREAPKYRLERSAGAARQDDAGRSEDHARRTLFVVGAGTFLVLVAFTVVVTSVGPSSRELGGGASARTWILSGMSLGLAAALLSVGVLADNVGRRRVFVWSTLGLALASGLAAISPTIEGLIAARVLQGLAGAGILAAGLGLLGHVFPAGAARTHATGIWAAMIGAGIAVGPAVSAALQSVANWRAGYWAVAVAAALLVPLATRMEETRGAARRRFDLSGALTLAASMACLTAGLTVGRAGWDRLITIALLAAAVTLLVAFSAIERRSDSPLVDLELIRRPLFVASVTGALFTGLALIALMSFLPLMLQSALGESALASAGVLGLWSATSMIVAIQARRLSLQMSSVSRLILGFLLCAAGVALLTDVRLNSSALRLAPGLLIAGVGSGLANAALGRLAVESVPLPRTAMGSGANNTARYVGGAAGIAIVVALVAAGSDRPGPVGLIHGWNLAAVVAAALCLVAAAVAAVCRAFASRTGPGEPTGARS